MKGKETASVTNLLIMKTAPSSSFALYLSRFREFSPYERESKTVLDSRFHAVDSVFHARHWIPVFVNETWILDSTIVSGIPDSLSCIQDSKAQHFHFHKQNFPDPRIRIPLHVWVLTGRIFKSRRPAFLVLGVGCLFWSPAS